MATTMLAPTLSKREMDLAIREARGYFDGLKLASAYDPNIADKYGLVSYVNGTSNPPPPALAKERQQVSAVLEGLCGVVTSAVLAKSGADDAKKHDPNLWMEPIRYGLGPYISGYSVEKVKYQRRVKGVEVATQYLNILLDAVSGEGGALNSFKKFLTEQGKTIGVQGRSTQENYKYACVGMVHEIYQTEGERYIYVPKIRLYFTYFTKKTFQVSSACASYDEYDFDFEVEKAVAPFRIEAYRQDPEFRKQVDDFIKKYNKANIGRSENYYEGIFDSVPAASIPRQATGR
jgi:Virulence factor Evf